VNEHLSNSDDIVARAADRLRDAPVPDGPAPETVARTLAALRAADRNYSRFPNRRFVMRTVTGLAAAVGVAVGVVYFSASPKLAFADVAKTMADAKTLSYRTTMELPGKDGKPQAVTFRTLYLDPGKVRQEWPGHTVTVMDLKAETALSLMTETKTAVRMDMKLGRGDLDGAAQTIKMFKEMAEKSSRPVGEKEIGGVKAAGFRVTEDGQEYTVWADVKTKLPVRVEAKLRVYGVAEPVTMVLDEFVIDPPLDEKLFAMDVPDGYKIMKVELPKIGSLEEEVAKYLKRFAGFNDGKFPAKLDDWAAAGKLFAAKSDDKAPTKEMLELATAVGALTAMLSQVPQEDFGYAGDGVNLGDAKAVVFWHKEKGKDAYKAVYGDLRIADIAKDQLPKR
jgi:outer membrane lipoprotein-sorting protein